MRLLTFLEYTAIVIGAIAILAGRHFALTYGVHIGIFLIGAGIAVAGIELLYTRQVSLRSSETAGYPEMVWGALAPR
jgi:hypothetical protein